MAETGLTEEPGVWQPAKGEGLPGLMASFQKPISELFEQLLGEVRFPHRDSPVVIRGIGLAVDPEKAARRAAGSSGMMPRSRHSAHAAQHRLDPVAVGVVDVPVLERGAQRLELVPVLKMATLRGRRTVTFAMPREASSGSSWGSGEAAFEHRAPCARSSPRRRMFWPGVGAVGKVIPLSPACVSSCITTASAPGAQGPRS
jgi:hypothetical protein